MPEDEVSHDLKQKAKLDKSANKIAGFLATKKEKLGSQGKPVKSNITDTERVLSYAKYYIAEV